VNCVVVQTVVVPTRRALIPQQHPRFHMYISSTLAEASRARHDTARIYMSRGTSDLSSLLKIRLCCVCRALSSSSSLGPLLPPQTLRELLKMCCCAHCAHCLGRKWKLPPRPRGVSTGRRLLA